MKIKTLVQMMLSTICMVILFSACGTMQNSDVSPYQSGSLEAKGSKEDSASMPELSQEELIGDYDPNGIPITLTAMFNYLDIEIDDSQTRYMYNDFDENNEVREFEWDVTGEEDERIMNPPGINDTYHINQYDSNGNLIVCIYRQLLNESITTTGISVYERTSTGEAIACYRYVYDDYEWEYVLRYISIYHDGEAISCATYDLDTHKRTKIEIYAAGTVTTVEEITCDADGYPESYCKYEYDGNKNITKILYYNLNNELESYITREYDNNGRVAKIMRYNSNGELESYSVYTWGVRSDLSDSTVSTYDAQGNLISNDP